MTTPILGLPELTASQNQKYLTVNQVSRRIDALINLTVFNRTTATPPVSPSEGDRYIVAATATGDWVGQETNIAVFIGAAWIFFTPSEGWRAYDQGANQHITFNGSAWVVDTVSAASLNDASLLLLGVNATADSTNRLSVQAPGSLFDAETDDFNMTLNKAAAGDDAIFTLQTGFSTRAIFGLLTNDDFTLRVSPNGSSFFTALSIDKDTGHVGIGGATADATNALSISGDNVLQLNSAGDVFYKLSKDVAGSDAAFDYQTNFTSYALMGLLGNNDFTFKVGTSAITAIVMENTTGAVELTEHPKFSAYLNFGQDYTAGAWRDLLFNNFRHNDQGDAATASNVLTFTAPHDGYYLFGLGATYEAGSAPTKMQVGFRVNTTDPTGDLIGTTGDATVVSGETHVNVTALIKLSASDTVQPRIFFTTNDGRVLADENYMWGCQIA